MKLHFYQRTGSVILSFLLGCIVCTSCVREPEVQAGATPPQDDPYYVSPEQALQALAAFETDETGTRTSSDREVSTIEVLQRSACVPETRSGESTEDRPLAYVMNFRDQGYAIVGADIRHGGVVALVEKGRMDAQTLAQAKRTCDVTPEKADLSAHVNGTVVTALMDLQDVELPQTRYTEGGGSGISWGTGIIPMPGKMIEYQPPLLKTEWTQGYPYNSACPWVLGVQCPVGCQAQAMAQVVIYNRKAHGYGNTVIGALPDVEYRPNWSWLIRAIETPAPADNDCLFELVRFLRELGKRVNMNYTPSQSIANTGEVTSFLRDKVGYKNATYKSISIDDIRELVYLKKAPIEVDGSAKEDYYEGEAYIKRPDRHIWVVDGWRKQQPFPDATGPLRSVYNHYTHHRFGYGGELDGWYLFNSSTLTFKVYFADGEIYYTL